MQRFGLSKSKLMAFRQCPRRLWLSVHMPDCVPAEDTNDAVLATGTEVGVIARQGWPGGILIGAPGRAHSLGGGSPPHTRHGEVLAEGKGVPGDWESGGSRLAKRWHDEQEADTRRHRGVSRPNSVKPDTCTERDDVDPTCISVKVGAQYPGRPERVPRGYRRREATGWAFRSQQRP